MADVASVILANHAAQRQNDLLKRQQIQQIFSSVTGMLQQKAERDRQARQQEKDRTWQLLSTAAAQGAPIPDAVPGIPKEQLAQIQSISQQVQDNKTADQNRQMALLQATQTFQATQNEADRQIRREGLSAEISKNLSDNAYKWANLANQNEQGAADRAARVKLAQGQWDASMKELDKNLAAREKRDMLNAFVETQGRGQDFQNKMKLLKEDYRQRKDLEVAKLVVAGQGGAQFASPTSKLTAAISILGKQIENPGMFDSTTVENAYATMFSNLEDAVKYMSPEMKAKVKEAAKKMFAGAEATKTRMD